MHAFYCRYMKLEVIDGYQPVALLSLSYSQGESLGPNASYRP